MSSIARAIAATPFGVVARAPVSTAGAAAVAAEVASRVRRVSMEYLPVLIGRHFAKAATPALGYHIHEPARTAQRGPRLGVPARLPVHLRPRDRGAGRQPHRQRA